MRYFPQIHDYVNIAECISEVLELRNINKCHVVGLTYTYIQPVAVKNNNRSFEFRYRMRTEEEKSFNHNRLDVVKDFNFQFVNNRKIYSVKQSDWLMKRVAPFGCFSEDKPWNLEWNVFGFVRGVFPDVSDMSTRFFRYISPIAQTFDILRNFEFNNKNIGVRCWTLESILICVSGIEFSLYKVKISGNSFLVIDNLAPITPLNFD